MINLILTSDFPASASGRVLTHLRRVAADPRIAWISASTDADAAVFQAARDRFGGLGFHQLEVVDIDEQRDDVQIAYLHEFDVIFLSGTDPVRFRYNAIRAGLAGRLRQCAAAGRLIMAAGAGALLLTPNVSLFRLHSESVDDVLASRGRFDALGAVSYELLPHADQWDSAFIDKVREYSSRIDNDIVALADGSAIFPTAPDAYDSVGGITRYRKGQRVSPTP